MSKNKTYIADNIMIDVYVKKGMRWEIFNIMFNKYQDSVKGKQEIEYSVIMAKSHIECIKRLMDMTETEAKEIDKKMENVKR